MFFIIEKEPLAKLPAQYDPRGLFGGDGVVFSVSSWPSRAIWSIFRDIARVAPAAVAAVV